MTGQDLITRMQNGDTDAFRQFYDEYAPLVYKYIFVRINNHHDTEDLTADVFVKVWKALPDYEWKDIPITAWLFRIAYNTVVDRYRRKKFSLTSLMPWTKAQEEHQFQRIDHQDEIRRVFATLSYEQQIVLYLNFYEGYSLKEIADFLGKSPNAVRVIKHRTLKQLNEGLAGDAT